MPSPTSRLGGSRCQGSSRPSSSRSATSATVQVRVMIEVASQAAFTCAGPQPLTGPHATSTVGAEGRRPKGVHSAVRSDLPPVAAHPLPATPSATSIMTLTRTVAEVAEVADLEEEGRELLGLVGEARPAREGRFFVRSEAPC
jgi:hypothetical protein